jgi:hypothetical protein
MSEIFVFLNEIPILDVFNAVQAKPVDVEILHPADERGLHKLPAGRQCQALARDRIVTSDQFRVAEEGSTVSVAKVVVVTAAGVVGVRVRLALRWVEDEKVVASGIAGYNSNPSIPLCAHAWCRKRLYKDWKLRILPKGYRSVVPRNHQDFCMS